tara:strand:- start:28177 stop:29208 length:1032 start_codon:yes stop_codon:yes gene_type:complete
MSLFVSNRITFTGLILIFIVCTGYIALHFGSGQALVGIRNSLIAEIGSDEDFNWTPRNKPESFKQEMSPPPEEMQQAITEVLRNVDSDTDFQVALALSRHLSDSGEKKKGGIRTNTADAYRIIRSEGRGYCADYSQVMNGLAYIADIPVREWGMSFDAFTGKGHAFNEIYSERYGKWIFLDSFYSFYVIDPETQIPLSALEFQEYLGSNRPDESVIIVPVVPERFRFGTAERALRYYRKGADQFYLYMGNDVFTDDSDTAFPAAGDVWPALGQSLAIIEGTHPEVRIVPTRTNGPEIAKLFANRNIFFALIAIDFLALLLLVLILYKHRSTRQQIDSDVRGGG